MQEVSNITGRALEELKLPASILKLFAARKDAGIICREEKYGSCFWGEMVLPSSAEMWARVVATVVKTVNPDGPGASEYAASVAPKYSSKDGEFWREYGFIKSAAVLSSARVNWLQSVRKSDRVLGLWIDYLLSECAEVVNEAELVQGHIAHLVTLQNVQPSELKCLSGVYDFIVPASIYSKLLKGTGVSITQRGVAKVVLPFSQRDSAEEFVRLFPGRTIRKVGECSHAECFYGKPGPSAPFSQVHWLVSLPVGSKIASRVARVCIPEHYVVEEEFVYGEIARL